MRRKDEPADISSSRLRYVASIFADEFMIWRKYREPSCFVTQEAHNIDIEGRPNRGGARFIQRFEFSKRLGGDCVTLSGREQPHRVQIRPKILGPNDGQWNFSMPEIPAMPNVEIPRFNMSSQNPMLGIVGESLGQEDQLAEFFGVQDGVLVRSVRKGSAAEKAGIKAGDVITKVDDSKVTSSMEITRALRNAKSKKTITVTLTRNKHEMPLTVTVEATTAGPGTIRAE